MDMETVLAMKIMGEMIVKFFDDLVIEENTWEEGPTKGKLQVRQDLIDELQSKMQSHFFTIDARAMYSEALAKKEAEEAALASRNDIDHFTTEEKVAWIAERIGSGTSADNISWHLANEVLASAEKASKVPKKGFSYQFTEGQCCFPTNHAGAPPLVAKQGKNNPVPCDECKYLMDNVEVATALVNRFYGKLTASKGTTIPLSDVSIGEQFLVVRYRWKGDVTAGRDDDPIEPTDYQYTLVEPPQMQSGLAPAAFLFCKKCGNQLTREQYQAPNCYYCNAKDPSKAKAGERILSGMTQGMGVVLGATQQVTTMGVQMAGGVHAARYNVQQAGHQIQQPYQPPPGQLPPGQYPPQQGYPPQQYGAPNPYGAYYPPPQQYPYPPPTQAPPAAPPQGQQPPADGQQTQQ